MIYTILLFVRVYSHAIWNHVILILLTIGLPLNHQANRPNNTTIFR